MSDIVRSDGIHLRAVVWAGIAIAAMLAGAGAGAYFAWQAWRGSGGYEAPNAVFDLSIAGAVLESAPQADRAAYMAEKEKLLHGYQWIDRKAGIARIPVEEAMRIMAGGTATAEDGR